MVKSAGDKIPALFIYALDPLMARTRPMAVPKIAVHRGRTPGGQYQ